MDQEFGYGFWYQVVEDYKENASNFGLSYFTSFFNIVTKIPRLVPLSEPEMQFPESFPRKMITIPQLEQTQPMQPMQPTDYANHANHANQTAFEKKKQSDLNKENTIVLYVRSNEISEIVEISYNNQTVTF